MGEILIPDMDELPIPTRVSALWWQMGYIAGIFDNPGFFRVRTAAGPF